LTNKKLSIEAKKPFRCWTETASDSDLCAAVEDVRTLIHQGSHIQMMEAIKLLFQEFEQSLLHATEAHDNSSV